VFKRRKPEGTQSAETEAAAESPEAALPRLAALPPRADVAVPRPGDPGIGVPPFRPAAPKEASSMARTPFAPVPPAPSPSAPLPAGIPPRPAAVPGRPATSGDPAERRTLVVGRGISLQGTVTDAERLVVEGMVEASTIQANELSVALGGVFKGEIEVDEAEVAGVVDGTLTARHSLQVRSTGKLLGVARCKRLQVEDGGQITGRIEMITDGGKPVEARPEAPVSISRPEPVG
jgi:cytoskeletal protein CcmA (bactofilin family)